MPAWARQITSRSLLVTTWSCCGANRAHDRAKTAQRRKFARARNPQDVKKRPGRAQRSNSEVDCSQS
eukprot:177510-Amphidinium_carterae.1